MQYNGNFVKCTDAYTSTGEFPSPRGDLSMVMRLYKAGTEEKRRSARGLMPPYSRTTQKQAL